MRTYNVILVSLLIILLAACTSAERKQEVSKADEPEGIGKPRILFVLTSHSQKGDTGDSTGFYLSEAAHPWEVLKDDYEIDFVSPKGGKVPVDGMDLEDPVNKEFWENDTIQAKLLATMTPDLVNPDDYAAIHFVGGHGAMWDFPNNKELAEIAAQIYENGGVVSAVCHGPAALVNIQLSDSTYLVEGKNVAGFSNEEEEAVELTEVVPFLLEDELKAKGAHYRKSPQFSTHVENDERLITGQNPQSAKKVGEEILKELKR